MSKKHDAYAQIRLKPDVAERIVQLKASSDFPSISFTAFVDSLIRSGILAEEYKQAVLKRARAKK